MIFRRKIKKTNCQEAACFSETNSIVSDSCIQRKVVNEDMNKFLTRYSICSMPIISYYIAILVRIYSVFMQKSIKIVQTEKFYPLPSHAT